MCRLQPDLQFLTPIALSCMQSTRQSMKWVLLSMTTPIISRAALVRFKQPPTQRRMARPGGECCSQAGGASQASSGAVAAETAGGIPGLTSVPRRGGTVMVCLGDLSCGCSYSGKRCSRAG